MTRLHNMSCAPRATISHTAAREQRRCRGLAFVLPAGIEAGTPVALLSLLGGPRPNRTADAEGELRRKLNEHAQTLALPPVALVADHAGPEDLYADGLLDICTVLAKSSGRVYLRDKEPNLTKIRPGTTVVVQLPPEWRAKQ